MKSSQIRHKSLPRPFEIGEKLDYFLEEDLRAREDNNLLMLQKKVRLYKDTITRHSKLAHKYLQEIAAIYDDDDESAKIECSNKRADALNNTGLAYLKLAKYTQMLKECENSDNSIINRNILYDEALTHWEEAIRLFVAAKELTHDENKTRKYINSEASVSAEMGQASYALGKALLKAIYDNDDNANTKKETTYYKNALVICKKAIDLFLKAADIARDEAKKIEYTNNSVSVFANLAQVNHDLAIANMDVAVESAQSLDEQKDLYNERLVYLQNASDFFLEAVEVALDEETKIRYSNESALMCSKMGYNRGALREAYAKAANSTQVIEQKRDLCNLNIEHSKSARDYFLKAADIARDEAKKIEYTNNSAEMLFYIGHSNGIIGRTYMQAADADQDLAKQKGLYNDSLVFFNNANDHLLKASNLTTTKEDAKNLIEDKETVLQDMGYTHHQIGNIYIKEVEHTPGLEKKRDLCIEACKYFKKAYELVLDVQTHTCYPKTKSTCIDSNKKLFDSIYSARNVLIKAYLQEFENTRDIAKKMELYVVIFKHYQGEGNFFLELIKNICDEEKKLKFIKANDADAIIDLGQINIALSEALLEEIRGAQDLAKKKDLYTKCLVHCEKASDFFLKLADDASEEGKKREYSDKAVSIFAKMGQASEAYLEALYYTKSIAGIRDLYNEIFNCYEKGSESFLKARNYTYDEDKKIKYTNNIEGLLVKMGQASADLGTYWLKETNNAQDIARISEASNETIIYSKHASNFFIKAKDTTRNKDRKNEYINKNAAALNKMGLANDALAGAYLKAAMITRGSVEKRHLFNQSIENCKKASEYLLEAIQNTHEEGKRREYINNNAATMNKMGLASDALGEIFLQAIVVTQDIVQKRSVCYESIERCKSASIFFQKAIKDTCDEGKRMEYINNNAATLNKMGMASNALGDICLDAAHSDIPRNIQDFAKKRAPYHEFLENYKNSCNYFRKVIESSCNSQEIMKLKSNHAATIDKMRDINYKLCRTYLLEAMDSQELMTKSNLCNLVIEHCKNLRSFFLEAKDIEINKDELNKDELLHKCMGEASDILGRAYLNAARNPQMLKQARDLFKKGVKNCENASIYFLTAATHTDERMTAYKELSDAAIKNIYNTSEVLGETYLKAADNTQVPKKKIDLFNKAHESFDKASDFYFEVIKIICNTELVEQYKHKLTAVQNKMFMIQSEIESLPIIEQADVADHQFKTDNHLDNMLAIVDDHDTNVRENLGSQEEEKCE